MWLRDGPGRLALGADVVVIAVQVIWNPLHTLGAARIQTDAENPMSVADIIVCVECNYVWSVLVRLLCRPSPAGHVLPRQFWPCLAKGSPRKFPLGRARAAAGQGHPLAVPCPTAPACLMPPDRLQPPCNQLDGPVPVRH